MIAMLGMYDMPAVQPANDRFWAAIRAHLTYGPDILTRDRDFWEMWQDPQLVLAQTCGMPFRTRLHGQVAYVGTPDYDLPGCPPGYYQSHLIARADASGDTLAAFSSARFAYNEGGSQSGWAAPMTHFQGLGYVPGTLVQTGAHRESARAVAEGRADLAAIDAQTWRLLQKHDPIAAKLRVVDSTVPTPGLPFITAATHDAEQIAQAASAALTDLSSDDRATLGIRALVQIPVGAYLSIPTPPPPR